MTVLFVLALFGAVLLWFAGTPPMALVVFVGSSSIADWALLQQDFSNVRTINRGIGGSELADSIAILKSEVIPHRPRTIVIYAGENDLDVGKTPEAVYVDFKTFVAKIHATLPETRIVFISIKPSPSRWHIKNKIVAANALIAEECAKDTLCRFVDVYRKMLTPEGKPNADLFQEDMLHMNNAGYAIWKHVVGAALE
ncbi:MAG: Lipolytic protein G-D-S-L family [Candidatus Kaiserbacteria bacterium GW2011_GWB1_52_6]|uniref:Lipolytic protein G-D-S-L family n=3 Tax=Candidatus Kaiseribacteriota TaxID=1752734 RepID=A0A0G1XJY4_9BACT|nr:MAG: Lipolytic protein G-D-S-L family [Candidatus Kaiserbacteria bacterium GW2011_GWA2_52_12]KKW28201.1 MAG: Lipolytic protein G-D-S-L family [Candidatus Kaiserbacteria bacterium GW2011_GWB1_52_6]KKW31170.1 MAG: Lipolytic protein G-D-S-L family [Candidatus Kaiserbacteria bacterium GW2011_GWC2_52_8b]